VSSSPLRYSRLGLPHRVEANWCSLVPLARVQSMSRYPLFDVVVQSLIGVRSRDGPEGSPPVPSAQDPEGSSSGSKDTVTDPRSSRALAGSHRAELRRTPSDAPGEIALSRGVNVLTAAMVKLRRAGTPRDEGSTSEGPERWTASPPGSEKPFFEGSNHPDDRAASAVSERLTPELRRALARISRSARTELYLRT
jgi:hypothetical protein